MWFKFPKGCEAISVERQQFAVEATGSDGGNYFRAPDHFAPFILSLGMGFAIAADVPEGAPADLPKADPLRDSAIAKMAAEAEGMKIEIQNLRSDLIQSGNIVKALQFEKAQLQAQLDAEHLVVARLREELEDAELPASAATPPAAPLKALAGGKGA